MVRLATTVVALVWACLSPVAHAAEFDVTDAAEFASALDTADTNGEDDTINIAAGIYDAADAGGFVYDGSAEDFTISLVGAGNDMTVLDGGESVRPLDIDSIGSVSVIGVTFENGDAGGNGGGLRVETSTGDIRIDRCGFRDNTTPGSGGGALARSTDGGATFSGNVFLNTQCSNTGGGGYAYTLGEAPTVVAAVEHRAGRAVARGRRGGGVHR